MLSPEYAVRNPTSGQVITVPDNSKDNARKMASLVPGSVVVVRMVSEWETEEPRG